MHYCEDENLMLDAINNTVREAIYKTSPDVFFYNRPSRWIANNVPNTGKYLYREIVTKSLFTLLVVINSLGEFYFSLGMK